MYCLVVFLQAAFWDRQQNNDFQSEVLLSLLIKWNNNFWVSVQQIIVVSLQTKSNTCKRLRHQNHICIFGYIFNQLKPFQFVLFLKQEKFVSGLKQKCLHLCSVESNMTKCNYVEIKLQLSLDCCTAENYSGVVTGRRPRNTKK